MARLSEFSKNSEKICEKVTNLALYGMTESEMAKHLDIAESTFSKWKNDHPEFSEAIKKGKEDADCKVAAALYKRATGFTVRTEKKKVEKKIINGVEREFGWHEVIETHYPPDVAACSIWLRNRSGGKWTNNPEGNAGGGMGDLAAAFAELASKLPN